MASNDEGKYIGDMVKQEGPMHFSREYRLVDASQTLVFGEVCQAGAGGRMKTLAAFAGAGVDCVQTITCGGTSTGGSMKVGIRSLGDPVGAIRWTDTVAWHATEATMTASLQAALDDLLGANVIVATEIPDTATPVIVLTFSGTGATNRAHGLVGVDTAALTGCSTAKVAMTTQGGGGNVAVNEVQTATTTETPDGGTFTLSVPHWNGTTITTAAIAWDANAATIETAIDTAFALVTPAPTAGGITVSGTKIGDDDIVLTYDGAEFAGRDWPLATVDAALLLDAAVVCSSTFAETTKGSPAVAGVAVAVLITTAGVTTAGGVYTTKGLFIVRHAILDVGQMDFGSGNKVDAIDQLKALGILSRTAAEITETQTT